MAHAMRPSRRATSRVYGKQLDLGMLVLLPGRERTGAEYGKLLEATGVALARVIGTESEFSILEALPV
jgi:hypothetical protein